MKAQYKQRKAELKAIQKSSLRDARLLCLADSKLEASRRKVKEDDEKRETLMKTLLTEHKGLAELQTELQV